MLLLGIQDFSVAIFFSDVDLASRMLLTDGNVASKS